jgi:peptidyl-prolyl cis-trans isomerase B (cyclophilin B)
MKKYMRLLLLVLCAFLVVACGKKEKGDSKVTEEITEGTIEGFHFKETDEVTDRVKIQMENGDIILIVLSNNQTPITKANFQKLVSEHFYDGIIFHRVIQNFMIQGGDPTGTGFNGSNAKIKGEFSANGVQNDLKHTRGVVSMARSNDMNSASSQFFICTVEYPSLDGNYAAFGKVFAGMDAVDKIEQTETDSNDRPVVEQKIKSIRFIEIIKD